VLFRSQFAALFERERITMSFAFAGVIALALLAYLVFAMFNPERFK
jgi:K+-transporting ATPase KdpF subunit